jgi:hypothetical protein
MPVLTFGFFFCFCLYLLTCKAYQEEKERRQFSKSQLVLRGVLVSLVVFQVNSGIYCNDSFKLLIKSLYENCFVLFVLFFIFIFYLKKKAKVMLHHY